MQRFLLSLLDQIRPDSHIPIRSGPGDTDMPLSKSQHKLTESWARAWPGSQERAVTPILAWQPGEGGHTYPGPRVPDLG